MLSLLLILSSAHAADAHYHPDTVAMASVAFARAQEASAGPFEQARARTAALAAGLERWRLALDLLGDRAPASERAALDEATRRFFRDQAVLSGFANRLMSDFDDAFSGALDRALAAEGGQDWPECRDAAPRGLRMGPGARATRPACEGEDRSEDLAARMDTDPALTKALDEITQREWPSFTVDLPPGQATEGAASLDPVAWISSAAPDALQAIDLAEEQARVPVEAALEEGGEVDRAALQARVDRITAATAAARAELAAPVWSTVDPIADKLSRKGVPDPAWCPRPRVYGGCDTPPMAADAEEQLRTHPKVRKVLDRLD